jgi:hypothetical protein
VGINKKPLPRRVAVEPGSIHAGVDAHGLSGVPAEPLTHIAGTGNNPGQVRFPRR